MVDVEVQPLLASAHLIERVSQDPYAEAAAPVDLDADPLALRLE